MESRFTPTEYLFPLSLCLWHFLALVRGKQVGILARDLHSFHLQYNSSGGACLSLMSLLIATVTFRRLLSLSLSLSLCATIITR